MIKLESGLSRLKECYLFAHLTYSILSVTCFLEWLKSTSKYNVNEHLLLWVACLFIIIALIPAQHLIITKTFFQDTNKLIFYKTAYAAAICILYVPIVTRIFAEGSLGVLIIVPVVLNSIICGTVYGVATSIIVAAAMFLAGGTGSGFAPGIITSHILTLAVLAITAWFIGQAFDYVKELLNQLIKSERDYRNILDKLDVATLYLDSSHQVIEYNQRFRDLIGVNEPESLDSGQLINYHLPFIKGYVEGNALHPIDQVPIFGQAYDSQGTMIPVQCAAYPTSTDLNDKNSFVLCINDISLSKKLEEEKIRTNFFIDFFKSGLILADATGKIIEINKEAEVLLNRTKEVAINKNITALLTEVTGKQTNPATLKKSSFELQLENKTLLFNWADLRSADRLIGSTCIINDITDQKELERKMHRTATLSAIGELAAGTAHEIRNPLTSIRGFLQLLLEKKDQAIGNYENYFEIMLTEVDRINTIVSEFLKLAKPEKLKLDKVNLNDAVLSIWELLKSEALLKEIQLELTLDQSANPVIMGNIDMLKQVLINLVSNAFQAVGPGGQVLVATSVGSNGSIVLTVHDNGPGMEESVKKRIFDPFFTTRDEGTGLGLAITNKIVDDHNAMISVTSSPGEGTTFYIKFPPIVSPAA